MFFIARHSVMLVTFLAAISFAWRTISKRRNASINAWALPFVYFSFTTWIVYALQYASLIARSLSSVPADFSLNTGVWLGVMQNVLWITSILSLYLKRFFKVSQALPLLVMISIIIGVVSYQTTILTFELFALTDTVLTGAIFLMLGFFIWQLRVNRLCTATFFLHGFLQWIWRYPTAKIQAPLVVFPLWHIALLWAWTILICEMLVTSKVMISSTVKDLIHEREAVDSAIRKLNLDGFRAEKIGSLPYTPKAVCALWAEQSNVFILIIGQRYGSTIEPEGISGTHFEYEVARANNVEKILVYVKEGVEREERLQKFLDTVLDFQDGHFVTFFTTPQELVEKVPQDVIRLLAQLRETQKP